MSAIIGRLLDRFKAELFPPHLAPQTAPLGLTLSEKERRQAILDFDIYQQLGTRKIVITTLYQSILKDRNPQDHTYSCKGNKIAKGRIKDAAQAGLNLNVKKRRYSESECNALLTVLKTAIQHLEQEVAVYENKLTIAVGAHERLRALIRLPTVVEAEGHAKLPLFVEREPPLSGDLESNVLLLEELFQHTALLDPLDGTIKIQDPKISRQLIDAVGRGIIAEAKAEYTQDEQRALLDRFVTCMKPLALPYLEQQAIPGAGGKTRSRP